MMCIGRDEWISAMWMCESVDVEMCRCVDVHERCLCSITARYPILPSP